MGCGARKAGENAYEGERGTRETTVCLTAILKYEGTFVVERVAYRSPLLALSGLIVAPSLCPLRPETDIEGREPTADYSTLVLCNKRHQLPCVPVRESRCPYRELSRRRRTAGVSCRTPNRLFKKADCFGLAATHGTVTLTTVFEF